MSSNDTSGFNVILQQAAASAPPALALSTASLVKEQQPAAPASTVIAKVITGDNRIDPLIDDISYRFNVDGAVGSPVTVTFSFPATVPASYSGEDALEWKPFSAAQQAATREVLTLLQQQIGITFQEVTESATVSGTMRFGNTKQTSSSGYAYMPNSTQSDRDGDTFMAIGYDGNPVKGDYNWGTLVHEIGHAIGLNHPGNYNAGESRNTDIAGNFLSADEDAFFNSIMSYRQSAQDINGTWFMPYDMLALRYLYGKKDYATGNNTYTFNDASGTMTTNIVDDGGVDTFDFSALPVGVAVNLTPGSYSSVGKIAAGAGALANLTTSLDAIIENVIGSALADALQGNAAGNAFTGGAGDDTLNGAAGIDTAAYAGARSAYTVAITAQQVTVSGGTDGADTLTNVERLQFSDTKLALDLGGHAGQVAKLLGACFGAAAVANKQYVGIGLSLLDTGTTYEQLAGLALGVVGANTPETVVNLLWTNLFGSAPTAEQAAPYVAMLGGSISAGALTVMAADLELNTNQINLVGLAGTGLEFA
jgi:hypothetical protein